MLFFFVRREYIYMGKTKGEKGGRGTGTGRGMCGQPVGVGIDPDDDEGAAALLAPEPRQGRVHRAALAAAAGRGLHAGPRFSAPRNQRGDLRPARRSLCCRRIVLRRRLGERCGEGRRDRGGEMECPRRHAAARSETGESFSYSREFLFFFEQI